MDDYVRKQREKQARIIKGLHDRPTEGGSPERSAERSSREGALKDAQHLAYGLALRK